MKQIKEFAACAHTQHYLKMCYSIYSIQIKNISMQSFKLFFKLRNKSLQRFTYPSIQFRLLPFDFDSIMPIFNYFCSALE